MNFYRILLLLALLLASNVQFAQNAEEEEDKLSLDKGPISNQFDYIAKRSGNYRADGVRYEVVKESNLFKIRKNVLDSIAAMNKKTGELKATIAEHETTITSLNKKLEETTTNLGLVTEEKDSMSFLGLPVSKGTYNFVLWTIIGALFLTLGLFIYKFRNSNILTQEAKQNLSELEVEYEDHRRRALEREQKISRQLQDEINKQKKTK
ncbi:MAG TPA: tRNA (guanine-N1)-methyltransferase [Maribacter sp.]|uniref:tRNA (guanine-N1)-methyltransferase n=1 Tax=unclassified Maribacter TaxID=2615042 RepID=UPI000EBE629B|nr:MULTISPECIES: tRNA (guanine-N1)-methyltransferase [unclassified Maribacter]HAF78922.1 tRNA (guanine-N1)-methyltransferase [Maribacter sp.]HAI44516.1 tRNA (guanine-N1)-methyltransferase [Maribacter sp.]|tara:strand:+ start:187 stop:810 length:624 start_codon:yes stop_codon:yes gene_type:complete